MSRPIRDPEKLELTTHALDMARDRNIGGFEIKKAIREGEAEVGGGRKSSDDLYRLTFPGPDLIVIVDPDRMNITTVFYDDEQGAERGGI